MKLLLDTCTFLWIAAGSSKLSKGCDGGVLSIRKTTFLECGFGMGDRDQPFTGPQPLPKKPELYVPQIREKSGLTRFP
ncbi:MAG: hypothetical protein WDO18_15865 [Acidobacteriota bacterium]